MTIDWRDRYREENTPWDLGGPHPELARRLERGDPRLVPRGGGRAFVPGCGRGHDALALARAGWEVVAMDAVPELEEAWPAGVGGLRFAVGDALAYEDEAFDLLFEHTFFCAIPRQSRSEYGAMARRLVAPGGALCALVFPIDRPADREGPPHAWNAGDLAAELGPGFALEEAASDVLAVERREWREGWATFVRER